MEHMGLYSSTVARALLKARHIKQKATKRKVMLSALDGTSVVAHMLRTCQRKTEFGVKYNFLTERHYKGQSVKEVYGILALLLR